MLSNAFDCRNNDRVERKYYYNVIARPLGLHNHFVSPSVRPLPVSENVHNSRTTMHGIYLSHFAYMCMSTFPYHSHAKPPFLFIYGFAEQIPACQLLKIFITLEPYGLFGSNFAYLFILILSSYPGMQNGGESLSSIILAGQGL